MKEYFKGKKGKKFLKEQDKIENKIKNWPKLLELEDAFKYYELFYNYKYYYTKEDNEFLSFSRRREKTMSSYYLRPRMQIYKSEEECAKCKNNKKVDRQKYKNNQNININKKTEKEINKNWSLKLSLSNINIDNNKKIFVSQKNGEKSKKKY